MFYVPLFLISKDMLDREIIFVSGRFGTTLALAGHIEIGHITEAELAQQRKIWKWFINGCVSSTDVVILDGNSSSLAFAKAELAEAFSAWAKSRDTLQMKMLPPVRPNNKRLSRRWER